MLHLACSGGSLCWAETGAAYVYVCCGRLRGEEKRSWDAGRRGLVGLWYVDGVFSAGLGRGNPKMERSSEKMGILIVMEERGRWKLVLELMELIGSLYFAKL